MGKVVKSFEECRKEIALRLLNEMCGRGMRWNCEKGVPWDGRGNACAAKVNCMGYCARP